MGKSDCAGITQRALYASLLSIVASALMLFGTTFAWFTANTASAVSTLTAASFDAAISDDSFGAGEHTVTLRRIGEGAAPGFCRFTLTMTGSYTETTAVTYSNGSVQEGDSVEKALSDVQVCYAEFSGGIDRITFTLRLIGDSSATITDAAAFWGSHPGAGGTVLRSRSAQAAATEITDGMTIDFGMDDQTVDVPATQEQEDALAAENAPVAEEDAPATDVADEPIEPTEAAEQTAPTDNTENDDSEDDDHGQDDTDSAGAGSGEDADPAPDGADGDGGGDAEG